MRLTRFARHESGSVLPTFALALIPVFTFVGASVDYSRASNVRAHMQSALDATALMVSKDTAALTDGTLQTKAAAYFNAQFVSPEAKNVQVSASYTTEGGSTVLVSASGNVKTHFMGLMGITELNFSASSTVKWGNTRLRLALVLDNTGSMASANKLTALKTAAQNLLRQVQAAATKNGDVYVSIIPFSKNVNVGPGNHGQSWVRWDLWEAKNGSCSRSGYNSRSACQGAGHTWTPDNHDTWNGCITDRDQDEDTTATAPNVATTATLFPAEEYSSCPVPLMALSYDWTALKQRITDMSANGNTNQTIGLQWGFQSLVANAPLTVPPIEPAYKYQHAIVLLTDGLNTQNRWSTSQSTIDARTRKACDNVKAAGITLYVVQVNTDGDPTSTMLQRCASDSSKFFLLTSATQIVSTFDQIGTALSNLRIAK